ncbi:MAG: hypothetical protein ACYDCL_14215 [Myxococcales bacterium]
MTKLRLTFDAVISLTAVAVAAGTLFEMRLARSRNADAEPLAVAVPEAPPPARLPALPAPLALPSEAPSPARPALRMLPTVALRAGPRRHRHSRRRRAWSAPPAAPAPLPPPLPDEAQTQIAIRTAVRALLPLARACYDDSLKRDPRLAGAATFRLQLNAGARVAEVEVKETLAQDGAELVSCLGRTLRHVALPAAAANMEIEVPFVLEPGQPGQLAER